MLEWLSVCLAASQEGKEAALGSVCRGAWRVQVNLQAVEQFIRVVGEKEDAIFQRRMRMLQRDKRRREQDKVRLCCGVL